ncbi:ornithine cyclodeaminase family protein [Marinivivus vitaminiproducens]|uniref:ornithine cyclodeaminase family protein n=1 Tax=Marinivivus vitaminiproducens TaxID=3035935 RepID=UPI00279DCB9C|nr:ornithine cyclodeaminase family protein [Geminicoccaceae bacterium SCSIO 64248]
MAEPDPPSALRLLDADAVARALPYARLVVALRTGFRADIAAPVRHHHRIARGSEADGDFLLMPAWQPGEATGVKLVTISPGNDRKGLASIQGLYVLFDGVTGTPQAVLDAASLTVRRTACASALAASFLARKNASHLVMIGAGALAPHLVRAHATVRPIKTVSIWNRTPAKAEALAKTLSASGLKAEAVSDLDPAIARADIVSSATMSPDPLIKGETVPEGCHLDLVGAYRPTMREADNAAIERAEVYVDTREGALAEAGDLIQPIRDGVLAEDGIRADLFDLCRGRHPGRRDAKAITLFKSVGSALEDLIAARLALQPRPEQP